MIADLSEVVEAFVTIPLKLINNTFGIFARDYAIQEWNNKSIVDWWDDDKCNTISGTDGVQYAPGLTRNQSLRLFNPNLCRTLPLEYEKDVTVHGIKSLRFSMPANTFATSDINPENKCYCDGEHCTSGILPMNCKKGGDEKLQTSLEGVHSSPEKHKTYVDVEPITGFVLNAAFRVQLNGVAKNLPLYNPTVKCPKDSIVPVVWME
ncbi:lysosome membrane protein 2 [Caerostris extrusa]|uniref:Lysosome membrane protein 2 n=1 Tax=Caerostris extrusa TaxID=172846 RepID=A0AAV4SD89_CAEEX|nr:lysosome membrane protein 2 [Caerostris extrusa]